MHSQHSLPAPHIMTRWPSHAEWKLHMAILSARRSITEAPWYALWNIMLKDFLFHDFLPWPHLTIMYPQFLLTIMANTYDEKDEIEEGESDEDTESESDSDSGNESLTAEVSGINWVHVRV